MSTKRKGDLPLRITKEIYMSRNLPRHIEKEHIEKEHIEKEHIEKEHIEKEHIEKEHIEKETCLYISVCVAAYVAVCVAAVHIKKVRQKKATCP